MGLMLSILCALIGFMECQGNLLPEDHITSVRCNIPQLLRKLCLCKMFNLDAGPAEKEQDKEEAKRQELEQIRAWDDDTVQKKEKEKEGFFASKIKSMSNGKCDEFLVYLLVNLPFNFMIACYTIVGPPLIEKDGTLIRSDLAGLWQLGSPVAVEMINLPTTFLDILLVCNLNVSLTCFFFVEHLCSLTLTLKTYQTHNCVSLSLLSHFCVPGCSTFNHISCKNIFEKTSYQKRCY